MDKTSIIEKINKEKLKLKIKQRNTLPGKPLISLTLIRNINIFNLLTNFILAVWLIKKFILVAWPVERQGLLFQLSIELTLENVRDLQRAITQNNYSKYV